LIEGFEYGTKRIWRDDDGEIAEQGVVDLRCGTCGKPKQRRCGKQAGKESEDEIKTQLGCASDQIVVEQGSPGVFYDDTDGDAFEVPKGVEGKAGDEVPDTPLQLRGGLVEDGIVNGDVALLSTLAGVAPKACFGYVDAWDDEIGGWIRFELPSGWCEKRISSIYLLVR
jgi:hypothetical protein